MTTNGHFVGDVNKVTVAARVNLNREGKTIRIQIGGIGTDREVTMESEDRSIALLASRIEGELVRVAGTERPANPVPKPKASKRQPMICPDCYQGVDMAHCDTCHGAGWVKAG